MVELWEGPMSDDSAYKTGYRKPPLASRFKPGRSGNSKGRPKGSKNYNTLLFEVLDERRPAASKGRRTMPRLEALVRSLVDKALEGEVAALKAVFGLMQAHDISPVPVFAKRVPLDFRAMIEVYGRKVPDNGTEIPCSSGPDFPVSDCLPNRDFEADQ
jgi:hypothetical protein